MRRCRMKNFIVIFTYLILLAVSYTLGWYMHGAWFFLPVLLGVNLIQSAFTGTCPIEAMAESMTSEKAKVPPPSSSDS